MAAYRRVYDSRHPQADYQEPGSAPEPLRSAIECVIVTNYWYSAKWNMKQP